MDQSVAISFDTDIVYLKYHLLVCISQYFSLFAYIILLWLCQHGCPRFTAQRLENNNQICLKMDEVASKGMSECSAPAYYSEKEKKICGSRRLLKTCNGDSYKKKRWLLFFFP